MEPSDLTRRSPLRALDEAAGGGLEPGQLGIVIARHGVGKTPFVVGIAIDGLLRGRQVLHVSLDAKVDHVREYYEQIYMALVHAAGGVVGPCDFLEIERRRRIHAYIGGSFGVDKLAGAVEFMREHAGFSPDIFVVDGFDFSAPDPAEVLPALRELARTDGAVLWMTAVSHREQPVSDPDGIPSPVAQLKEQASIILDLQPEAGGVKARILKPAAGRDLPFVLDPTSMLLRSVG